MKRLFLAALALALGACGSTGIPITAKPPAPLAATTIDEKGLLTAYRAFDALLTAVDALVAGGVLVPGSETATRVARELERGHLALRTASAARKAGSATDYASAMLAAQAAFSGVDTLVKGE